MHSLVPVIIVSMKQLQHMLLLSMIISMGNCELFPISDTSYPHIFMTDPATVPLVWHKKFFAFRLVIFF
jgi:hypothetical protein